MTKAHVNEELTDRAPGDEQQEGLAHWGWSYTLGLAFATILTAASFWVAIAHPVWGPSIPVALIVLAIAQMGVHLVFFLHVTTGPDNTNNVLALAYGLMVVFLVVVGSIWIMDHLNNNMMPMEHMNEMH